MVCAFATPTSTPLPGCAASAHNRPPCATADREGHVIRTRLPGKLSRRRWIAGCVRRAVQKSSSTYIRWLLATVGALLAASAYGQKVTTDSNPSAPFASYKTYGWTDGTPAPNPLAEQRI